MTCSRLFWPFSFQEFLGLQFEPESHDLLVSERPGDILTQSCLCASAVTYRAKSMAQSNKNIFVPGILE
jgi:hypothetical protein